MRSPVTQVVALVCLVSAPVAAGWNHSASSDLRPDRHGPHPETIIQRLALTQADRGASCLCVSYRSARQGGARGTFTVVVTVNRASRAGDGEPALELRIGPVRVEDVGAGGTTGRACAPIDSVRRRDEITLRWEFTGMAPLRSGFLSKTSVDVSVGDSEDRCR